MKNTIFLLAFSLLLFGCKKDSKEEVLPELNVRVEEYGRVYITNMDLKAVKFSIDYGDGRIENNFIDKFSLYNEHKYSENRAYTLLLTTWDIENNKTTFSKTVSISDIPPKPVADFTVVLLDNGRVQCQNLSKNTSNFEWHVNRYKSITNNPVFIFEKNGEHEISLRTSSVDGTISTKNLTVKITNANEPTETAEFNGQFFDKKGRFTGTNFNDFYGPRGLIALPNLVPSCIFVSSDIDIRIVNFNGKPEYENLKNIFVVGNKNIYGKNKNYKDSDWYFAFQNYTLFLADAITSDLEIIDVKEINQPKLIPEMYEKAFWLTFKIKADFGNGKNIDGTLRVRYLIY